MRNTRISLLDERNWDDDSGTPARAARVPEQRSPVRPSKTVAPTKRTETPKKPVKVPTPRTAPGTGTGATVAPALCKGCQVDISHKRTGSLYCETECGRLFRTYGMGLVQYAAVLAAQGGKCAICKKGQRICKLAVDHDHKGLFVVGILCLRCNRDLLGHFGRNPELFEAAARYLRAPPAVSVLGVVRTPK